MIIASLYVGDILPIPQQSDVGKLFASIEEAKSSQRSFVSNVAKILEAKLKRKMEV